MHLLALFPLAGVRVALLAVVFVHEGLVCGDGEQYARVLRIG